ncbi:MAG: hypothetical protein JWL70_2739, partial [Acidimicrobiia bacterium]|nr:hypothetical protein [Acidimicrobiia bacterium]
QVDDDGQDWTIERIESLRSRILGDTPTGVVDFFTAMNL